jgi:hypothetical protein
MRGATSSTTDSKGLEPTASNWQAWVERYPDWPEDIAVPSRTADDCLIALPDGSRRWVSLPPPVRALLPRSLSRWHKSAGAHFGCDVFDLSFPLEQRRRQRKLPPPNGLLTASQAAAPHAARRERGTTAEPPQSSDSSLESFKPCPSGAKSPVLRSLAVNGPTILRSFVASSSSRSKRHAKTKSPTRLLLAR